MMKYLIGLTGGIGSGKTTVAKFIEAKGFAVYYSDIRAKEIVNDNSILKSEIINLLGDEAYDEEGSYNRKWVADKIFNDDTLLMKLNTLIHPAVKEDFEHWMNIQQSKFIFKETALLFELNLDKNCYKSVLVTADESIRIARVMERDHKTYSQVKDIIQKQMSEEEKAKRANYIIYNNGDLESLSMQTNVMLESLFKDL
ncbi:dephospho-CoA kinase [Riemerella columbipharyngis]|uniref:Dephospho-CoA kinase n=2 Tax=Riemerella columbipharyngis TaxID=1071918 RepID=A0A1G6Z8I1_9FLAO|nr:dephospho-CoA kinase [Riemerella columbipharyngis]